jgi:hypothetical protein
MVLVKQLFVTMCAQFCRAGTTEYICNLPIVCNSLYFFLCLQLIEMLLVYMLNAVILFAVDTDFDGRVKFLIKNV